MRKQALRYTLSGVVGVVLAIALTVMVNWLAARHYLSADWTSSKMYSISDKTANVLKDLDQEIRVIVFMTPASPLYDQVYELLSRYAAASDKIVVEYIDPDKEPLRTRQLAEQFGISVADTVVFSYGDRTKYVTSDQMADYDYAGMQYGQAPTMRAFTGEEQFTSAILSLVAPDVPKVYFVTGHGEASLENAGGGAQSDRSLAILAESLKRENIETADTVLLTGSRAGGRRRARHRRTHPSVHRAGARSARELPRRRWSAADLPRSADRAGRHHARNPARGLPRRPRHRGQQRSRGGSVAQAAVLRPVGGLPHGVSGSSGDPGPRGHRGSVHRCQVADPR